MGKWLPETMAVDSCNFFSIQVLKNAFFSPKSSVKLKNERKTCQETLKTAELGSRFFEKTRLATDNSR